MERSRPKSAPLLRDLLFCIIFFIEICGFGTDIEIGSGFFSRTFAGEYGNVADGAYKALGIDEPETEDIVSAVGKTSLEVIAPYRENNFTAFAGFYVNGEIVPSHSRVTVGNTNRAFGKIDIVILIPQFETQSLVAFEPLDLVGEPYRAESVAERPESGLRQKLGSHNTPVAVLGKNRPAERMAEIYGRTGGHPWEVCGAECGRLAADKAPVAADKIVERLELCGFFGVTLGVVGYNDTAVCGTDYIGEGAEAHKFG